MALLKSRVIEFEKILNTDIIDLAALQSLCFNGIPDEGGFRSLCWKLLLNYLPLDKSLRASTLRAQRSLYMQFVDEMISSPSGEEDHPLNLNPNSSWGSYFKDNEVLLQIDKDVRRLCPDISFFQSATEFPCEQVVLASGDKRLHKRVADTHFKYETMERKGLGLRKLTKCKKSIVDKGDYFPMAEGNEAHWEVVERMLFLYAKLNPGQGYVQGMNEIIGPIYHVFAVDPDKSFREHAEADCFFCFTNLMSEIRDCFIKSLDEAEGGINQMMDRLEQAVHMYDEEVWKRLKELDIKPQYYSFRWLTLLLSQEFSLPEVDRIWDSLFADKRRFDFLIQVCCAMIILLRDQILEADFATVVKLLQNFPPMDVSHILSKAVSLRNEKTIKTTEF